MSHHHKDLDLLPSWDPQPAPYLQPLTPMGGETSSRICAVTFEMKQDLGHPSHCPFQFHSVPGSHRELDQAVLRRDLSPLISERRHVDVGGQVCRQQPTSACWGPSRVWGQEMGRRVDTHLRTSQTQAALKPPRSDTSDPLSISFLANVAHGGQANLPPAHRTSLLSPDPQQMTQA